MSAQIRFAPLIRVSTESQEQKGESLRTQEKQIRQYVDTLGGIIPKHCWKYTGQEHATPGHDRKILKQLLKDSSQNRFDAVIVCDASRWSRDNSDNVNGLKILKENGISFFLGQRKMDLFSPQDLMLLSMFTIINEFHATEQTRKSLENRIERAKRRIPTNGKMPYGRTFKNDVWGIDAEKAEKIKWAAKAYLDGEGLVSIAKTLGMNHSNLWKILSKRSGTDWAIHFRSERLNISERVPIKIPRLLSAETIKNIHKKAAENKTYTHGQIKNNYLLSRVIFCAECGYAMFGQTNHGSRRYYRHARHRQKPCNLKKWVKSDEVEAAVLVHLFEMFGDAVNLEKALQRAIPNQALVERLNKDKKRFERELEKVKSEEARVIRSIARGTLSDEEADPFMKEIRERKGAVSDRLEDIQGQLETVPSKTIIQRRVKNIQAFARQWNSSSLRLQEMTFEDKRKLIQHVFAGKDFEGNRCGVYVRWSEREDAWQFTIKGVLDERKGWLPMLLVEAQCRLGIETEYTGNVDPFTGEIVPEETIFVSSLPAPALHGRRFPAGSPPPPG